MEVIMVITGNGIEQALSDRVFRSMFEERKRVFVDLLGWDIPVLACRYEIDQFDDDEAVYIVITDDTGEHAGSARLLQTDRPHILDTIFPNLCDGVPPTGPNVREITRFCLARRLKARERLATRNRLVSALVEYALSNGILTYTGVAEWAWFQQILAFGWECLPLGLLDNSDPRGLSAMQINIGPDTPNLLSQSGVFAQIHLMDLDRAAA
ncbi:acyl-homoserine-lactone synthase [Sphingobium sp. Z007]|nr:acyl-homoserine-lactone synthase [Sphingobium sp. Z007]